MADFDVILRSEHIREAVRNLIRKTIDRQPSFGMLAHPSQFIGPPVAGRLKPDEEAVARMAGEARCAVCRRRVKARPALDTGRLITVGHNSVTRKGRDSGRLCIGTVFLPWGQSR